MYGIRYFLLLSIILTTAALSSAADDEYVYYPSVNKFYKYHHYGLMLHLAARTCTREGAKLAIPRNTAELAELFKIFNTKPRIASLPYRDYIWTGLHDSFVETNFISIVNGEPSANFLEKWASGEPGGKLVENCVIYNINLNMYDVSCVSLVTFLCEKDSIPPEIATQIDPAYISHPHVGKLYKFHANPMAWHYALEVCRREKAVLAMPRSNEEVTALTSFFGDKTDRVFVGFHDGFIEGDYLDTSSKALHEELYTWAAGQPNNLGDDEDCGSMNKAGELDDISCKIGGMFVCEKNLEKIGDMPTSIDYLKYYQNVPYSNSTAIFFDSGSNRRYSLHLSPRTWLDANRICLEEHSYLVVINSQQEADTLANAISMHTEDIARGSFLKSSVLVGLTDLIFNGVFTTNEGVPMERVGYSVWAIGHPNNSYHCGALLRDGKLASISCDMPAMFLCEKMIRLDTPQDNFFIHTSVFFDITSNRQYRLHMSPRNWMEANKVCMEEYSWLTVINSPEEANLLVNALTLSSYRTATGAYDNSSILVGLTDHIFSGQFTTNEGLPVEQVGYEIWSEGEPNKGLHCGAMRRNGQLAAVSCDTPAMFFCEKMLRPEKEQDDSKKPSPRSIKDVQSQGRGVHFRHSDPDEE